MLHILKNKWQFHEIFLYLCAVWFWYSCIPGICIFFSRFYNIEEINAPEVMPVIVNYKYHVKSLNRKKNDNYKKPVNHFSMVSIISFLTSISCGGLVMVGRTYTHSAGKSPFFLVRMHSPIHQPEFITVSPFCWSRTIRSPLLKDRKEEPSPTEWKNHVRQQKQSVNTVHLVYLTHSLLAPLQKSTVNFYLGQPYLWFTIMIGKLVCSYQYMYLFVPPNLWKQS